MEKKIIIDKKNNILDIFNFDITEYFNEEYYIIGTEDSPAVQIVNYEISLSNNELEIFDTLQLMVMFDKYFINSSTHMNATYLSKSKEITIDEIKKTTNYLYRLLGSDDLKQKRWSKTDLIKLQDNKFNRIWPTGMTDSFLKLSYKKETGFELSILFLNNLLDNLGRKIIFN